jgi:hypothetical protein
MNNEEFQSPIAEEHSPRRPFCVTILALVVLIFTSLNAFRSGTAIHTWDFLTTLQLNVPNIYFVVTGLIWSVVGVLLIFGLLTKKRWSIRLGRAVIILFAVYYWFDRLLIAERVSIISRWQFTLGLTFLLVIIAFWILGRPTTKEFLSK